MATIRTVAAHEVVRSLFPREVTERDQIGMAAGKAIDSALAQFSHLFREGRRPSLAAVDRLAAETLDEELQTSMLQLQPDALERQLREISGVLRAFRASEVMGLPRPKSRLIVINEEVGVYAQPDYWNGRDRFYEMKSYHADPVPPAVLFQIRLFQLAFPGFKSFLAEFDRHAATIRGVVREIPPARPTESEGALRSALDIGRASGAPKVLEYVDNPVVRYSVAPWPAGR